MSGMPNQNSLDGKWRAILGDLRCKILDCGSSFEKECICDKHIANALSALKSCVVEEIKKLEYKRDWEDEPIGAYHGYTKCKDDVLRRVG